MVVGQEGYMRTWNIVSNVECYCPAPLGSVPKYPREIHASCGLYVCPERSTKPSRTPLKTQQNIRVHAAIALTLRVCVLLFGRALGAQNTQSRVLIYDPANDLILVGQCRLIQYLGRAGNYSVICCISNCGHY